MLSKEPLPLSVRNLDRAGPGDLGSEVVRAHSTVTLHTGSGRNTASNRYWRQDGYVWNNSGDTAS
jgi:hypothetical protein